MNKTQITGKKKYSKIQVYHKSFPNCAYFTDEFKQNGTSKYVVHILLYAEKSAVAVWKPVFQ